MNIGSDTYKINFFLEQEQKAWDYETTNTFLPYNYYQLWQKVKLFQRANMLCMWYCYIMDRKVLKDGKGGRNKVNKLSKKILLDKSKLCI